MFSWPSWLSLALDFVIVVAPHVVIVAVVVSHACPVRWRSSRCRMCGLSGRRRRCRGWRRHDGVFFIIGVALASVGFDVAVTDTCTVLGNTRVPFVFDVLVAVC